MTCNEVMSRLEALGDARNREINIRRGTGEKQFGVKMGDIRNLAKEIKTDHALGLELWKTGHYEGMMLSCLIMSPKKLTMDEVDAMQRQIEKTGVADMFNTCISKLHPQKEELRLKWMADHEPMPARGGWSLTTERVLKKPEGLDLNGLLDRIEQELATASEPAQWTMNYCLASIGIEFPELRERALAIGEKLGVYRDYPVSKGCVSPYAPIWITEMVSRHG